MTTVIDVKSKNDSTKVGVLTIIGRSVNRLLAGHTLKVYSQRTIENDIVLYCTGNPGGYAERAILTNGNFKPGDVLIIENIH